MIKPPVLILGARSDMARAIAHRLASVGHPIQLAARNVETLDADRTDLALRYGVPVTLHEFDALATDTHEHFLKNLPELPFIAVCAVGLMGQQEQNERDLDLARRVIRSNFEGPASILALLANHFERRGSGVLVGISSVAGERGRASNYVYGSAKAGFTAFLSGLRNRLSHSGVHVVTILPGFVATKMTEHMQLPPRLVADPAEVAHAVAKALVRKTDVLYVRPIWRWIMLIIQSIPERLFKRMRI